MLRCFYKIFSHFIIKRYELYNHLKEQKRTAMYNCKIRGGFSTGLTECFYDLMNYISINEM